MRNVPPGTKGTYSFTVADRHLANATDPSDPILLPVLASKEMILAMEFAAMNAMRPFLDPGETSAGIAFDVQHLAATPPGHRVRVEAELVKHEGKRLEFKVSAFDEADQIGSGIHARGVINSAKFAERVKAKIKKAD
jgi:fluoroacetyl-CoA thioesterase